MAIEGLRRRTDRQTTGGLGNISRAFAHRNYLVYVSGNSISLIGWWLERVAVGWLTWTLTHSGAWLGLISLADFLPVLVLAPFAGVLADRRDRVRTIRLTQWIGCLQASLLAILVVNDAMTIEILRTGMHTFKTEKAAQRHCPADTVVWVNTSSANYHFKGDPWYGRTQRGIYACKVEADKEE